MTNKIQTARQPRFGFDRNSPLGRFWRWWTGELGALIPLWLRQTSERAGNALLVEITSHAIVVRRWLQGTLTELGRVDLTSGDHQNHAIAFQALANKLRKRDDLVALWLTDAQFLVKQIDLPLATAENMRQVLGFEMDRHTPFKAEQVYFDFRVMRKDAQHDRLNVRLVLAPCPEVDSALDLLARWGLPANAVYAAGTATSGDDPVDLMPAERRTAKSTALQLINLGLSALAVGLVFAAIAIPILQKRQVSIELVPIVERAKQQAEATDLLRREWEKRSAEYNFVLEKKQAVPPLVALLDELSRLLPDDTWVHQFDIRGKELQIQGETASSSKLIALLESAKMLGDASFRSPLTKGASPNSERFHLAAVVKPLPAGALAASIATAVAAPSATPAVAAPGTVPAPAPAPAKAVAPAAAQTPQAVAKTEPAKSDKVAATVGSPSVQPTVPGTKNPQSVPPGIPGAKPNLVPPMPNPPAAPSAVPAKQQPPTPKAQEKASGLRPETKQ